MWDILDNMEAEPDDRSLSTETVEELFGCRHTESMSGFGLTSTHEDVKIKITDESDMQEAEDEIDSIIEETNHHIKSVSGGTIRLSYQ